MFKLLVILLAISIVNSCDVFKNLKVQVYTDSNVRYKEISAKNPQVEFKGAHKIAVTGVNIPKLCEITLDLDELETVEVDRAQVKEIEVGAFKKLKHLRNIAITHNSIKQLPKDLFAGLGIRKLNLSSNGIEEIHSDAFDKLPNLEVIDLSGNKIKEIDPKWFKGSHKVYWIILNNNLIKRIPENAFEQLAKNGNRRFALNLWVEENQLEEIHPKAFDGIGTFGSILLSHNKLKELDKTVFKNVKIEENVFLDDNSLTCLSEDAIKNFKGANYVDLSKNPIDCDCVNNIYKWGKSSGVDVELLSRKIECVRERSKNVLDKSSK